MNILLTSIGRRGYLATWFTDALGRAGTVHAASSDPSAPGLLDAALRVSLPPVAHPGYADALIEYCCRQSIDAVIPLIDVDVVAVAEIADELRSVGVRAIVPEAVVARAAIDKWTANLLYRQAGIEAPETYLGIDRAIEASAAGQLDGPLIIKPRLGMGAIGILRAEGPEDLPSLRRAAELALRDVHRGKDTPASLSESIVVQPVIQGEVFNIDVVCDLPGNFQTVLARKRLALVAGESFSVETVNEPDLYDLGKRLAEVTRHPGTADLDVIRREDGRLVPIDFNPRFGGGYPFSHEAGTDLPRAIVAWLLGRKHEPDWLRHDSGLVIDKVYNLRRR